MGKGKNNKIDKFIKQFYNNNEVRAKGYLNDDIDAVNEDIPEINNIADIVWWAKKEPLFSQIFSKWS